MNTQTRILVVDDDFTSRKVLSRHLENYGQIDSAVSGKEAIEGVQKALETGEPYDLICLDILMPELDGQLVLQTIRELETKNGIAPGKGAKIIMTTCLDDAKNIMQAFRSQCEAYLVKPITKEALAKEVEALGFKELA